MLSGLSSQMSGLDKGGGLGHTFKNRQKESIQEPLLTLCFRERFHIGSWMGCLILLLLIA